MRKFIYLLLVSFLVLTSCTSNDIDPNQINNNDTMQDLNIPDNFDFSSEQYVDLFISIQNFDSAPLPGIIYDIEYVSSTGEYMHILKTATNENGVIEKQLILPSYVEKLHINGLMSSQTLDIINGTASYELGPNMALRDGDFEPPQATRDYSYLPGATFNEMGVPATAEYWAIDPEIMARISTSLPESEDLNDTHPEYLDINTAIEPNFVFTEDVEVWITFVAEGASYTNTFGFYTYDALAGPPADPSSLDLTIVYPNCSYTDSGGGLEPGIKVYLGSFPAGSVLGWFLIQDGWDEYGNVFDNYQHYYSNKLYNPEVPFFQQHSILLYDDEYELFVIGFEDRPRPQGDNDFNDAVFIAHAIPLSGVDDTNIPPLDIPPDTDDDGVSDPLDDFPEDPERTFIEYYPSEGYATIVFEDLWPYYGDYDMNDLVLDYRYQMINNSDGLMKDINVQGKLRAVGASNNNGFSIEFPFPVSEVTLAEWSDNITPSVTPENNYIILDLFNTTTSLTGQPVPAAFNTNMDLGFHEPVDFSCKLTLATPVDISTLDFLLPFHRFIRQNGDILHEIHLINEAPTSRVNMDLFGTGDDASVPGEGSYYRSSLNLPWALSMPESWHYPAEQNSITEVYNQFAGWAESGGIENHNWYLFLSDRVDMEKVYIEP